MSDEQVLKMLEVLGDDAKTAFITYLVFDYGTLLIFFALATWGVRTFWRTCTTDKEKTK